MVYYSSSGEFNMLLGAGFALVIYMMFGWFGSVVNESMAGNYNQQVEV